MDSSPSGRVRSPPFLPPSRDHHEQRASRWAILFSLLLHLLVIALTPLIFRPVSDLFTLEERLTADSELSTVTIIYIAGAMGEGDGSPASSSGSGGGESRPPSSTPLTPPPPPSARSPGAIQSLPFVEAVGAGENVAEGAAEGVDEVGGEPEGPFPTVAERLRPQMIDPRLWAPVDLDGAEPTDIERAELLLGGLIQSWNDSIAIALALSDRATDWTFTDSQGRRWGLSPGRLHLGDFSIPLPVSLRGSVEGMMLRRRDLEDAAWIRADLERGRIQSEIREVWVERARIMRERMEAERRDQIESNSEGGDGP